MFGTLANEHGVGIHGYSLMDTHYHAQVTPSKADSLPRMMQRLGRRYVRYFNDRYRRTGTLWEGRYQSSLICDERQWFVCLRYVELNPVRAGMVSLPGDYEWSSHRSNGLGEENGLLTPHRLYLALGTDAESRAERWAEMCGKPLPERTINGIRKALHRNRQVNLDE